MKRRASIYQLPTRCQGPYNQAMLFVASELTQRLAKANEMIPELRRQVPLWESFCVECAALTETAGAWLADNRVSTSIPGPATHYDMVKAICASAQRPIPVMGLCEDLRAISLPRGDTFSNLAGDLLDRIASHYERVVWWVTDGGLYMEVFSPDVRESTTSLMVSALSHFDQVAGPLVIDHWSDVPLTGKTHLSAKALGKIAIELDRSGLKLLESLQPKPRKVLGLHNQKAGNKATKSFENAVQNKLFVTSVRRRLYVARDRYKTALKTEQKKDYEQLPIPEIYYSLP